MHEHTEHADASDYEIRIVEGVLLVNGSPAEDYLDCLERRYVVPTSNPVNGELQRVVGLAFAAGSRVPFDTSRSTPSKPLTKLLPLLDTFTPIRFEGDVD